MKQPGLDGRHRDKDGTAQKKRSDTLNKNLSPPIPEFSPNATLGYMRKIGTYNCAAPPKTTLRQVLNAPSIRELFAQGDN